LAGRALLLDNSVQYRGERSAIADDKITLDKQIV